MVGVGRVDPKTVVVAAETERAGPSLSAVLGLLDSDREGIDMFVVVGIDDDIAVIIAGTAADALFLGADLLPGRAAIIRAIDLPSIMPLLDLPAMISFILSSADMPGLLAFSMTA